MTLLEVIRVWGLEKLGRYYSCYRAIVIDPHPDEDNTGNIIVQIPGRVQGGMVIKARSKQFKGGPGFGCKYFTPDKGEVVWIEFENGNPNKPLWSSHTWANGECPEDLQDNNTCGIVTPHGNKVLIKESEEGDSFSITINDGSTVLVEKDKITFNTGENQGLVNIEQLRGFIDAVSKDLLAAKSGINVATWMATGLPKLEDTSIVH